MNGATAQRVAVSVTAQSTPTGSPIIADAFWLEMTVDATDPDAPQVAFARVSQGEDDSGVW